MERLQRSIITVILNTAALFNTKLVMTNERTTRRLSLTTLLIHSDKVTNDSQLDWVRWESHNPVHSQPMKVQVIVEKLLPVVIVVETQKTRMAENHWSSIWMNTTRTMFKKSNGHIHGMRTRQKTTPLLSNLQSCESRSRSVTSSGGLSSCRTIRLKPRNLVALEAWVAHNHKHSHKVQVLQLITMEPFYILGKEVQLFSNRWLHKLRSRRKYP